MRLPPLGRIQRPPPASADADKGAAPDEVVADDRRAPVPARVTGERASGPARSKTDRRLTGPVLAYADEVSPEARPGEDATGQSTRSVEKRFSAESMERTEAPDRLSTLLRATATPASLATRLASQRLLLPKGSTIDCTLQTAIDSSLPGLVTCLTPADVFSADGSTVLLERGTLLVGETRGDVRQGQARVYVLWSEARTPGGVVARLDSPGTDPLGRTGLPGHVERHFFERFGAALLISIVEGALQRAAQPNGNTVIVTPNVGGSIATEALKATVAIRPTIVKAHGDPVQIIVARDVDFRSVYELRVTP